MSNQETKLNFEPFKAIRVKMSTKEKLDHFLAELNQDKAFKKVTFDSLINYYLRNVTKEQIENGRL